MRKKIFLRKKVNSSVTVSLNKNNGVRILVCSIPQGVY